MPIKSQHDSLASRLYAGISFRPEVLAYLDGLAKQAGVSRSWVINAIVLEHARSNPAQAPSPLSRETVIHL